MRRHSTATLMGLTKRELVEYVRMAEHNQEVAEETLNQQAENVKDWKPVAHGRWIDRPNMKGQVYCSECATIEKQTDSNYKSRHCPNCGADMTRGAEDGK